jgi:hypothetical protein
VEENVTRVVIGNDKAITLCRSEELDGPVLQHGHTVRGEAQIRDATGTSATTRQASRFARESATCARILLVRVQMGNIRGTFAVDDMRRVRRFRQATKSSVSCVKSQDVPAVSGYVVLSSCRPTCRPAVTFPRVSKRNPYMNTAARGGRAHTKRQNTSRLPNTAESRSEISTTSTSSYRS